MQDLNAIDVSQISSSQHQFQENDILKINITSLEPKASIPYNKILSQGNIGNSLNLIQLDGYLVSKDKTINLPILGVISVEGKSSESLEVHIKKKLEQKGHLIDPNVTVRLLNAKVTVLGEVNAPGIYTFTEKNISFLQAIGLASDLTIDGNRKDIVLIRESDGQRTTTILDLTSASFLTSPYQNIQPNDVIIVNPNSKKVRSAGLVGNISTVLSIASILLSTIILIQ
ncbi:polysaccharide biosynthesis/export family protein [Flavobacteriaceae bacterium]|nr:polysaccharide biosynthesis/export family protein [Flavobacteriaceae bacterium]